MENDVTYRVFILEDPNCFGRTAASPELAKLVAGDLPRDFRLGMERTDWKDNSGKPRVHRSVVVDAEARPGEWTLGPGTGAETEVDYLSE